MSILGTLNTNSGQVILWGPWWYTNSGQVILWGPWWYTDSG